MKLRRLLSTALVACSAGVAVPSVASAATSEATSANWSGYVVHKSGVKYKRVSSSWTVPAVDCTSGATSYSANWIGLGGAGYSSSGGLEQLGTESDCVRGRAVYDTWFEILPAGSVDANVTVHAGDQIRASVTILSGKRARLRIVDATTGKSKSRVFKVSHLDQTSAEWIVEAPSLCSGASCLQTTVADFGSTGFAAAKATTSGGHTGTILDTRWNAIAVTLSGDSSNSFGPGREEASFAASGATPTSLSSDGSAFDVSYTGGAGGSSPQVFGALRHAARAR